MEYDLLVQQLYALHPQGMKLGLENMLRLDEAAGYPSKKFKSIHVAGTNGKGSVTRKIAAAVQQSGIKTGYYISPHISCFRERICVNGQMIPEKAIQELLPQVFEIAKEKQISATFFELTTLLAFLYFAAEKVEIAAIETGLGGRFDATNIIIPKLSIITSISLEHTEILGHTLEQIAFEKAGVIKQGIPVVLGPRLPVDFLKQQAELKNSPCILVSGKYSTFEEENCAIARTALHYLKVNPTAIEEGLKRTLPCRMEIIKTSYCDVILDVAHNPDGLTRLFQAICKQTSHPLRVIFGLSRTKDITHCLQILTRHATHIHLVEAPNGRGFTKKELYEHLCRCSIDPQKISLDENIEQSVEKALNLAQAHQETVVVCGTFFIMAAVRKALGIEEPCDLFNLN